MVADFLEDSPIERAHIGLTLTECSDGLPDHGNYAKILQMRRTPQELLEMICDPSFSMFDQWQVQKQATIQVWADVYLYSSLPREDVEKAMLKPIDSIEDTLAQLMRKYGPGAKVAVMPYGPLTIPYLNHTANVS